jgi:hypothetical protein
MVAVDLQEASGGRILSERDYKSPTPPRNPSSSISNSQEISTSGIVHHVVFEKSAMCKGNRSKISEWRTGARENVEEVM